MRKLTPILFVLGLLFVGTANAQPFRAGAATSNITPEIGGGIIGGFEPIPSTHVHDELHARCLVLDDGKTRLALVVCDLLAIHTLVSNEARRLIQESVGIPPSHVMISATHTHSACSALGEDRFKLQNALDDYQTFVARRIADGVRRAANHLRPAQIAFGTVEAPEHVFNRRWYMRPGTMPVNPFGITDQVKMNPPAGSPNLVDPAGPTDPTVSFVVLREPNGKFISVYAAYSLHYVGGVGSGHISADYYGMFCEHLKRLAGADAQDPPFVALLANGTSGDINNINFRHPRPRQDPYVQMRTVAEDVARKVHNQFAKLEFRDHATLDARYREPILKWRKPTAEQLEWAQKTLDKGPSKPGAVDLSVVYAQRTMNLAAYSDTTPIPLQVFRIGELGIGTMPVEIFCEIGLEFKKRSPLQLAFLVCLTHGSFGYLPTPRQHELGGYETWLGTNRLERDASDKMLAELLEMASEIKNGVAAK